MKLRAVRRFITAAANRTGVTHGVSRTQWRSARLLVLCYHGVSLEDEHEWDPELFIPAEQLRARFTLLRELDCAVLPLTEALERLRSQSLPPRAVSITFDDGNYDFYARAYPLLREFDLPATIYLTTYYCDHQRPVFDPAVGYLLWKARLAGRDEYQLPNGRVLRLGRDRGTLAQAAAAIRGEASKANLNGEEKDELLEAMARDLAIETYSWRRRRTLHLMTAAEVRQVAEGGVDIQLHTHRHRSPLTQDRFRAELALNRERIAEFTGNPSPRTHFCYPNGAYCGSQSEWLAAEGVVSAVTCSPGIATRRSNVYQLPRFVDTMGRTPSEFAAWCSGLSAMFPRRRRDECEDPPSEGATENVSVDR